MFWAETLWPILKAFNGHDQYRATLELLGCKSVNRSHLLTSITYYYAADELIIYNLIYLSLLLPLKYTKRWIRNKIFSDSWILSFTSQKLANLRVKWIPVEAHTLHRLLWYTATNSWISFCHTTLHRLLWYTAAESLAEPRITFHTVLAVDQITTSNIVQIQTSILF